MITQSALIFTSGLIFLFFSSPHTGKSYITNPYLIIFLLLLFTVAPSILLYAFARATLSRYINRFGIFRFFIREPYHYSLPFGILALGGFVAQIYYLQTPIIIRKVLYFFNFTNIRLMICIIPLVISIFLNRLSIYKLNRLMFVQNSSKKDFLIPDLKLMLLPSIPFATSLIISDIIEHTPLNVRIFFIKQYYIYWLIVLSIALIMFIKSPYFIRHIWKTVILPDGEVRRRIEALAKKTGLKYKDILVWKTGDKSFANAGMAGLLPKSRYIFITDSLLDNLSIDEIEAIIAHELGHIKHKHILTYMLYSFGYLLFFAFIYAIFHPLFKDIHFGTVATALLGAIATISIFFIYFIFIFRYFSRQFERQADLYSISVLDNPESFKSALIKVARINHIPLRMPRFAEIFKTHPSIFERLNLVDKAIAGDSEVLRYTNPIFSFRKTTAIITAFLLILVFTRKDFLFFTSDIHYEIGRQYANEGMIDAAINEFNKAVISNPKSTDAIFALGLLYAEKGAVDMAEKQFTKVLEMNPKNNFARERLNQLQENKKE